MVSRAPTRARASYRHSLPAPTGGWNTRDALAEMSGRDAAVLDNWIPGVGQLIGRKGYEEFAIGVGSSSVETLADYTGPTGQRKLLAAGGGGIYDITTGQAGPLKTGFISSRWDTVNFNSRTVFVNGADDPVEYDGSSIKTANFNVSFATSELNIAHVFKERIFYGRKNSLDVYYTELLASTGILTRFVLRGIAKKGGHITAINSWTVDGGDGPEDYIAFFTSQGEVLVYAGTDPGTDFAIVGRYYIGPLVDNRAVTQVFGKLYVATLNDYLWLPDAFQVQGVSQPSKLSGAAASAVAKHGKKTGWQAYFAPSEGLLLMNVPLDASSSEQHVLNLKTGAATRFTDLNAHAWVEFENGLYFGGNGGKVYKYTGTNDAGSNVSLRCHQAPSLMGTNTEKIPTAYRPYLRGLGNVTVETGLGYDFESRLFNQSHTLSGSTVGVLPMDWPFDWPTAETLRQEWFHGEGRGNFVQYFQTVAQVSARYEWHRTDFIVAPGGILE